MVQRLIQRFIAKFIGQSVDYVTVGFFCPFCGLNIVFLVEGGTGDVRCPHCRCQTVLVNSRIIHDLPCDFIGCGIADPFGFVPECGCPIHDTDEVKK